MCFDSFSRHSFLNLRRSMLLDRTGSILCTVTVCRQVMFCSTQKSTAPVGLVKSKVIHNGVLFLGPF
jgi:hypothetical protein